MSSICSCTDSQRKYNASSYSVHSAASQVLYSLYYIDEDNTAITVASSMYMYSAQADRQHWLQRVKGVSASHQMFVQHLTVY